MRGKGTEHRQDYRQNRITPAYAGKSTLGGDSKNY